MSSPLEQFVIQPIAPLEIAGYSVPFTNSALMMVLAVVLSTLLVVLGMRRQAVIPGRFQAFVEILYDFVHNIAVNNLGTKGMRYFPFVFSIFMFVLMGNMLGLMPFAFTYTSHIIVTFALAALVFVSVIAIGLIHNGFKFFTLFLPHGTPIWLAPLIIVIEIVSFCARPISLSVRLFANMMAGHMMLKIFAGFIVTLLATGTAMSAIGILPFVFNLAITGLEFFVAFLQAFIFTILTCIYLHDAVYLH